MHRHPPYCLPSALQLLTTSSPDRAPQQITDSGALATRLLEACLNAGLGVSEFDEMLSDEIANVASDNDVGESGVAVVAGEIFISHNSADPPGSTCALLHSNSVNLHDVSEVTPGERAPRLHCTARPAVLASMGLCAEHAFPDCTGGSLSDYREQLEDLRSLVWGHALSFVGGGDGSFGRGGGDGSISRSRSGNFSSTNTDAAADFDDARM